MSQLTALIKKYESGYSTSVTKIDFTSSSCVIFLVIERLHSDLPQAWQKPRRRKRRRAIAVTKTLAPSTYEGQNEYARKSSIRPSAPFRPSPRPPISSLQTLFFCWIPMLICNKKLQTVFLRLCRQQDHQAHGADAA